MDQYDYMNMGSFERSMYNAQQAVLNGTVYVDPLDKLRALCLATPNDTIDSAVDWVIEYIGMLQDDIDIIEKVSGYVAYKESKTGSRYTRNGYIANLYRMRREATGITAR